MNSILRSEQMCFCHLYLQTEVAFNSVLELGECGLIQFKDMNKDISIYQRKFITEVRQCENMERILRYLEGQITKNRIKLVNKGEDKQILNPRLLVDLEHKLERLDVEVKQINANYEKLLLNFRELTELKHLLRKAHSFFEVVDRRLSEYDNPDDDDGEDDDVILSLEDVNPVIVRTRNAGQPKSSIKLNFIGGVVARERVLAFQLMLFRICRGNALLKYADIEGPIEDLKTGYDVEKSVFLIFFQGEQLRSNILKVCDGFHCHMYPCPDTQTDRREMAMGVMTRLEDLSIVLKQTQDHLNQALSQLANGQLQSWACKVHKFKMIYHLLNQFNYDITQKCLIIECWCPTSAIDTIRHALHNGTTNSGASDSAAILQRIQTRAPPPTYHKVNQFTSSFQNIIDAYGVASYREINPAPFGIITFPFLFSVMFGDVGHGIILFFIGLLLILFNNKLQLMARNNELLSFIVMGRYLIFLMGVFSIYAGLIYNDIFGKCVSFDQSPWSVSNFSDHVLNSQKLISLDPANSSHFLSSRYSFGMDPVWQLSHNKINFLNSFKMKLSIIIALSHMTFAIVLSLFNHIHNRDLISIISEFIPQIIFFISLFGYLVALVIRKWVSFDATMTTPSLLIGFINMFLNVYPTQPDYLVVGQSQKILQQVLLAISLLCVPWLLFMKPFLLHRQHQRKTIATSFSHLINLFRSDTRRSAHSKDDEELILLDNSEDNNHAQYTQISLDEDVLRNDEEHPATRTRLSSTSSISSLEAHEPFNIGELLIHQVIHTIEFCLGCISNTASYLRLWALSLAHAQLSEVLWLMIMRNGLVFFGNSKWASIAVFILFGVWAFLSFWILVVMEGLSAFLHALRLHWVEFMNKFYKGEGHAFNPFKFTLPSFTAQDDD